MDISSDKNSSKSELSTENPEDKFSEEEITELENRIAIQVQETMYSAFWDRILEDIFAGNYDSLCLIIEEVKIKIIALIPRRADLHTELNEYIDVPYLKQMFEKGVYEKDNFIQLFNYIFEWILKLCSKEDDEELELLHKECLTELDKVPNYIMYIPKAFGVINFYLDKIKEDALKFMELIKKEQGSVK